MLRKIRIGLAAVFWTGVTVLLLDTTGALSAWLGWMAKIQFLPAVLAVNVAAVVVIVLATLLLGRVYCSVICPLGILQDIISYIRGRLKKKNRFRFKYRKALNWLRYPLLAAFIALFAAGFGSVAALIAPYSTYGRIVTSIVNPSLVTAVTAGVSLVLIFVLAWLDGRIWCNTVCPVGSFLGLISRFSLFAPTIDASKCRACGLCGRQCKASCIDMTAHSIDHSRCVACMDCIDTCREGAIKFRPRRWRWKNESVAEKAAKDDIVASKGNKAEGAAAEGVDAGRRAFLAGAAIAAGSLTLKAQTDTLQDALAEIEDKKVYAGKHPQVPAGARGIRHLSSKCIACQLCVNACPNDVLRPSTSLTTLMQPRMWFDRGWCRPECTTCSDVCPTGAILPVSVEEKTSIQTGHAVIDIESCLVFRENERCYNCIRHCPAKAVTTSKAFNPYTGEEMRVPSVREDKCIGCGACEHLCPVRPFSAIHVEGHEVHHTI